MNGFSVLLPLRKIWGILAPRERRQSIAIFLLMLVGMVLETLGIGLVIPAVALMTKSNAVDAFPTLVPWLKLIGNPTNHQVVMAGMVLLVAAYAVKTAFLAYLVWKQMRFVYGFQQSLSERLFAGYLALPYVFHLQRNSAQLVRNISSEVSVFQNGFLSSMLLLTEVLVICGVSILLILIEPMGALLVVISLGVVAYLVSAALKKRVLTWGQQRQEHEGGRLQRLLEGLGGVKDVKLLGCEAEILRQFKYHNDGLSRVGRRQSTLLALPRLVLELFAVVGITVLVVVMLAQGKTPESVLPTLAVFAAAAFRLMPSFGRVMTAAQSLQYAFPVVDIIDSELALFHQLDAAKELSTLEFQRAISVVNVNFQYEGAASLTLQGISLSIAKGASVGFIGGSGAGKSTLVDVLIGLLNPSSGGIKIDGVDIQRNLRGWQDKIGYVPQSIFLKDDTLRRNVAFGVPEDQIDERAVERAIASARLDEFVGSLPEGLETKVGERGVRLSGGQRQRIGIARALYNNPEVLVLDEATSSLDVETESDVMEAVNALHGQKTLLIVAHRLSTVAKCDRLFRLENGCLVWEGEPKNIMSQANSREFMLKITDEG